MVKRISGKVKHIWQALQKRRKAELSAEESEFLPAVLEITETPLSPTWHYAVWTVAGFLLIGLLWAIFGQVDEVAVAPGKLIPSGYVKTLQAEDKGIVKAIHVREGDRVAAGQALIELDPTVSSADFDRIRKEVAYYSLTVERLIAEREQRTFAPTRLPGSRPDDVEYQLRLYRAGVAEYQARLARTDSGVEQARSALAVARSTLDKWAALLEIAREKEKRIELLVAQDAVSKFALFDHQARRIELEQSVVAQRSEIVRNEAALSQQIESRDNIVAEREKDLTNQLVEARRQLASWQEELKKAEQKTQLARITAPVAGRVSQLSVHTLGAVVTQAQPLLVVVPEGVGMEAEVWVANKDIGFVQSGQTAELKVETFNFQKFGTVTGTVAEISPDAVDDKDKGRVYRVIVKLERNEVNVDGRMAALSPGMSVTGEIKIRQKRIIEFFLDPFKKYQSEGLRER
jgi:hemolysin D